MSLWDSFSNYVEKEAEKIKRETRRMLRSKSDQQIRNAYNNRYNWRRSQTQRHFLIIRLKVHIEEYKSMIIVFIIGLAIYCICPLPVQLIALIKCICTGQHPLYWWIYNVLLYHWQNTQNREWYWIYRRLPCCF